MKCKEPATTRRSLHIGAPHFPMLLLLSALMSSSVVKSAQDLLISTPLHAADSLLDSYSNVLQAEQRAVGRSTTAVSSSSSTATDTPPPPTHLVLHWDINETILVGDEAGGDTREDCLHKMLAKAALVQLPVSNGDVDSHDITPTMWWNGVAIAEEDCNGDQDNNMLSNDSNGMFVNHPALYVGSFWPPNTCPYYRTAYKHKAKTFAHHDGAIYKDIYNILDKSLQSSESSTNPLFAHLLPAFFETLVELRKRQQGRLTVAFRTMGSDLNQLAQALSTFARGGHPDYPDFTCPDWVLEPGALVRGRWAKVGSNAVRKQSTGKKDNNDDNDLSLDRENLVYQLWTMDGNLVASGDDEVVSWIHSHSICGIQDDYHFWKSHNFEPWAGKPVWIGLDGYHHLLLDDNIHPLEHDGIAGVRERQGDGSFESLPGSRILEHFGVNLIRVPTVAPLLRPSWFVEQISLAQARYDHECS
jgi:hypothetical protein